MLAAPRPEGRVRGFNLGQDVVDGVEVGEEGRGGEVAVRLLGVEGEGGGPDLFEGGRGGGEGGRRHSSGGGG